MKSDEHDRSASLSLSHGWKWTLAPKAGDDALFRIEQSNADARKAPSASIEVHAVDLPWIWVWLMGSYSAEEWPSTRNFPGGTVLSMDPNPKPEVWLVQFPSSYEGVSYGMHQSSRRAEPVGQLILYEGDLNHIVAWLEELSKRFGIDRRAAMIARAAREEKARLTSSDVRLHEPPLPTPLAQSEPAQGVAPVLPPIALEHTRPEPVREADEIVLRGYTGPGSKEMMILWPAFVGIREYYFPRNWITRLGRSLRLVRRVDYARSDAGLNKFLGDAARTLRTNRWRWIQLLEEPAPAWLAELRRLAFQQFQDELQAIATFGEAVEATRAGDNAMRRQHLSRVRYLMKCCRANRKRLSNLAMGSWYKHPTSKD